MWSKDGLNSEWDEESNTNSTASTTDHTKISQLSLNTFGATITGIVIAKEEPRSFLSKKDPSNERNLLSFTLRDSPVDFINATCWGAKEHIVNLAQLFHIGDVVDIKNPAIQSKPLDGSDEKFRPWTSSSYQLSVSETRGSVQLQSGCDCSQYNKLLHIPVKMSNDFYTLDDIVTNGQRLHGECLSILAAVKNVGAVKQITTKLGKQKQRCEVKLFDETSTDFALVLWDEENISLCQTLIPKEHVLFAADVRVTYDNFRKTMVSTANSKTIFTINPDTREAHSLFKYAQDVDIGDCSSDFQESIDIDSIRAVTSVAELKATAGGQCGGIGGVGAGGECPSQSIVFGFLSSLDLDSDDLFNVISVRCAKCRLRVDRLTGTCANVACPQGCDGQLDNGTTETLTSFDLRVSVTDDSGTLAGCHLSGDVADSLLGCTAPDFMNYDDHQRTELKWTLLLERYKFYIKIGSPSHERQRASVRILACQRLNMEET